MRYPPYNILNGKPVSRQLWMVILTLNEIELSSPLAQSINLLSKTIKFLSTEQMKKKRIEHDEENWEIAENLQMSEMWKSRPR